LLLLLALLLLVLRASQPMPLVALSTGIRTWYELAGPESGARVLYIGGSQTTLLLRDDAPPSSSSPHMERLRPWAALADAGFRVMGFDLRGIADADKPTGPYTMQEYADDAAALLEETGWAAAGPVGVVGVSFGGMILWHLALRHPALVQCGAICCGPPGGAAGDGWRCGDGAPYPYHELSTRWYSHPREHTLAVMHLTDSRQDTEWQAAHPEEVAAAVATAEAQARACNAGPLGAAGAEALMQCRGHHSSATSGDIATLTLPLLCAGGRYDAMVLPSTVEQAVATVNSGNASKANANAAFFEGGAWLSWPGSCGLGGGVEVSTACGCWCG
jgi:pimeloyl-ACP methyl ester carboxylesterase